MADRSSGLRDLGAALGVVGGVLLLLFLYSQVWPPMVVVESASMMHPHDDPGYGNIGTIDPGDMVVVKAIGGGGDVELPGDGSRDRYGAPGDVIVFNPGGDPSATPIIHRVVGHVEVEGSGPSASYRVNLGGGEEVTFGSEGIYLPEIGIDEPLYTPEEGYRAPHSGFLTKGDNPETNKRPDQVTKPTPLSPPVKPEWIQGESRGELPWFGLLKLSLSNQLNVANPPTDWVRIGNAFAPRDLWVMLFVSLMVLVLLPLSIDVYQAWREVEAEGVDPTEPLKQAGRKVRTIRDRGPPGGGSSTGSEDGKEGTSRARFTPVDGSRSEREEGRASSGDREPREGPDGDEVSGGDPRPKARFQVVKRSEEPGDEETSDS